MLIGGRNSVNEKLVIEISKVIPISFMDFLELPHGKSHTTSDHPSFVLLNLMDIGLVEQSIFRFVKERYPNSHVIALHCYQAEAIIQKTLDRGYDHYISILNFSEEFQVLLHDQPEIFQD